MHAQKTAHTPLNFQPWFLLWLAAYSVVELSFNHRLLELASDLHLSMTELRMHNIEIWGRLVSGMGLSLLLMRWLDKRLVSRFWLISISCLVGFLTMWHVQKQLVDTIVSRADQEDLMMSLRAQTTTQEALNGRVLLRGEALTEGPVPKSLQPVVGALWASSVLGLSPEDIEVNSGAAQFMSNFLMPNFTSQQLHNIYRKTVMTPVALGASLFFGLINLCQLFAGMVGLLLMAMHEANRLRRWQPWLLPVITVVCLALSWWPDNAWVASSGYSQIARVALWQEKPFLAPFVEWSLRAEPAWTDPIAWLHQQLLQDFPFEDLINPAVDKGE
jgi:hypothetical protein